ncbi:hypothetical protein PV10_01742 [Exophiala mesophila]|uniref:Peroxisomal membrane protein PEX14 n=1 Tax=Exophiala mesophila TaxID=212818 RepID=A0A0D1YBQ1_EXOME|nr:uncharacterized protein PV10_01742 [Exophiala mesophila]KIV98051.1 hypothetical protein PV10_01742 [Exophiala mesophila]
MADNRSRRGASIPAWQQNYQPNKDPSPSTAQPATEERPATATTPATSTTASEPEASSDLSLLEQAKRFLEDESIKNASREKKVAFLETKGVSSDTINALLDSEPVSSSTSSQDEGISDLKTIHDSAQTPSAKSSTPSTQAAATSTTASRPSIPPASTSTATVHPRRDIPPIITYPEFLLKPQKPPPLVTVDRLTYAAYALAGISAVTYGASKFIIQPMLQTLTEARQELASTTQADLEKLNSKLESVVSHVPYIPPSGSVLLSKQSQKDDLDETSSLDSDPTELFHRDIATQTSPRPSRSNSLHSSDSQSGLPASNPTLAQSTRLEALHSSLNTLLTSTNTHFSQDRFLESITAFKGTLDKIDQSYNPFMYDYTSTIGVDDKSKSQGKKDTEINKFKAEIRSLKGAFLSSRNFPTARPAQPFAIPGR